MDKIFLVNKGQKTTYSKLLDDINHKMEYSPYIYARGNDSYIIFRDILHSLVHQYDIVVLDGDFSERELQQLEINKEEIEQKTPVLEPIYFNDFPELLRYIKDLNHWSVSLYTSGTTGRPKKVLHDLRTLTRNVKVKSYYENNVWAFSYNPTHIAGIQVFFQAVFNMNTIVYAFDGQERELESLISDNHITHISATPTYYRNVLPYIKGSYDSVINVTFGGEKLATQILELVKSRFPMAKTRNIYASTEAGSLFYAEKDIFEISDTIKPFVMFKENRELLIHKSLLGDFNGASLEGEWFVTGDIIELIDDTHFCFVSRESELINVGGYKVNPNEVEHLLIEIPGVIDLVIKARENSITGNILVAEVVKEPFMDEKELKIIIKQYAAEHLQEWKVPRIIKFVDQIERSRTGKKVRK